LDAEEETPEGAAKAEAWKDGNEDGILVGSEERIAEGSPEGSREGKSVGVAEGKFDCSNGDRDMGVRKVPKRVLKMA
jgi:flagellar biosynthesis/type III secretory pathway protein FliH